MAYVDIVTALALLQFVVFGFKVGKARGRYGVKAPAITGNETFRTIFSRTTKYPGAADRICAGTISLQPLL